VKDCVCLKPDAIVRLDCREYLPSSSLHTQASAPVIRASPPHTPPNHRPVRLRRKAFTVDASGSPERDQRHPWAERCNRRRTEQLRSEHRDSALPRRPIDRQPTRRPV